MRAFALIAFTGAIALTGVAAFAQAPSPGAAPDNDAQAGAAAGPSDSARAKSADQADPRASSDTLGDASKLKAGDPNVVSNGPVPDTAADRAQYGKPLSDAGKRTAPSGD